ncbi:gluconate:H+ symporter [Scopulibacillus cellulosilyticus]|uniref:Gluconate:H+ symporter n=1 Tax=Scopulibacillus cellulosilyticus TaxID=2665665 RepID=A0ABW2PYR6_9BACL
MGDWYLVCITLAAIVVIILGVSVLKLHPFLSLIIASLFLGIFAGLPLDKLVSSYETGVGSLLSDLAGIIGLGTILGKMMADSGGGLQIANALTRKFGESKLHWAMMFSGFIIGLPVFFEVGVVLLLPLVISISKNSKKSILFVGLPLIAGLSIVHGIVPPHPGAMTAIGIYKANVGKSLLYGLIVAIPSAIVAGPLFGKWVSKRVKPSFSPYGESNETAVNTGFNETASTKDSMAVKSGGHLSEHIPSFTAALITILLPILLMLLSMVIEYLPLNHAIINFAKFIGTPVIALLISVFVAYFSLGFHKKVNKGKVTALIEECLKPLAAIMLIMGAGGGFKQVLVDSGVGTAFGHISQNLSLSPIVLAFIIAGLIRVATGSATVALTTAAGIVAPVAEHMTGVNKELLVIATGAGSLMLSHVNDSGFWLVKQYLGLSVKETFKTWTVLETLLSVTAFVCVLILNIFI